MLVETKKRENIKVFAWAIICFTCFVCFLILGDELSVCVNTSLSLCAKRLIPSLFPTMIASRLLLDCGAGKVIGRIFKYPCRYILGLSEGGAFAFLMGIICGFPIGAICARSLYDKGIIGSDELSLTVILSSVPSFAFVVGAIGGGMLGDRRAGVTLYLCAIASAIITGIIYRFTVCSGKVFEGGALEVKSSSGIVKKFTDAISISVKNMLLVCGFVVFFSLICEVIFCVLSALGAPQIIKILIHGVMELSGGALAATKLSGGLSLVACGAFIGWSGLCVHSQILSVCSGARVNIWRFLGFKLVFAVVCGGMAVLFMIVMA